MSLITLDSERYQLTLHKTISKVHQHTGGCPTEAPVLGVHPHYRGLGNPASISAMRKELELENLDG
jgi:hypothetical protein